MTTSIDANPAARRSIPRIMDFDDKSYDPFADADAVYATNRDPFDVMAEMRETGPVHEREYRVALGQSSAATLSSGMRCFMVVGYDEVLQVIQDPGTYSSKIFESMLGLSFGRTITAMDAPEHTRYRRIFQKAFLPHVVSKWGETLVDPVVQELLSSFVGRGTADLVIEFTQSYPFGVIFRMLNLPQEDTNIFHKLAVAQTNLYVDTRYAIEAGKKLGDYFAGMLADRRTNPGEDLVTALATAEVDGEKLPDEVVISFLRQLMNAGGDTTFRATSTLLAQLLLNPDQYKAMLENRSLLSSAIDEVLRWDTPVLMMYRVTTKDSVLGGVRIPAGSMIQASQGAANRDPKHFPDPNRFDIHRESKTRPLRFGIGPHVCIGQHLARLEMTRAVTALMNRLPGLRLDPDKPAPIMRGSELRSPDHVYVKFDKVSG
jgi:cytochrome P450